MVQDGENLIWQDPERMSGMVCFFGTRIPVQHLLDYLEAGDTIEDFCADYNVPIAQAQKVVSLSARGFESILAQAA